MDSNTPLVTKLPPDIWLLVFSDLLSDHKSLCDVSLTCKTWYALSLRLRFQQVDLSSHNDDQIPLIENPSSVLPVRWLVDGADYGHRHLVARQRAFLRLIIARPELASYVQSLTWTLIWKNWEDLALREIDRQTWNVFGKMNNVTRLDLASVHDVGDDDFVRLNPAVLFPKVTELRLGGWMHRGLVRTVLTSIDASQLRSLKLDYLYDEGAIPGRICLCAGHAEGSARRIETNPIFDPDIGIQASNRVDDELFQRQEADQAAIFPAPMWFPLRLLSARSSLGSLQHLQIKLSPFNIYLDSRSYYSVCYETTQLMMKVRNSLRTLTFVFDQCPHTASHRLQDYHYHSSTLAAVFLSHLLTALHRHPWTQLQRVVFEGFRAPVPTVATFISGRQSSIFTRRDDFSLIIRECPSPSEPPKKIVHVNLCNAFLGNKHSQSSLDEETIGILRRS